MGKETKNSPDRQKCENWTGAGGEEQEQEVGGEEKRRRGEESLKKGQKAKIYWERDKKAH